MYKKRFRFKKIVLFGVVVFALLSSKVVACQNLQKNQQLERKMKDVKFFEYARKNTKFSEDVEAKARHFYFASLEAEDEGKFFTAKMLKAKYEKLTKQIRIQKKSFAVLKEKQVQEAEEKQKHKLQIVKFERVKTENLTFSESNLCEMTLEVLKNKYLQKQFVPPRHYDKAKFSLEREKISFAAKNISFREDLRSRALDFLEEAKKASAKNSPEKVSFFVFQAIEYYSIYLEAYFLKCRENL